MTNIAAIPTADLQELWAKESDKKRYFQRIINKNGADKGIAALRDEAHEKVEAAYYELFRRGAL